MQDRQILQNSLDVAGRGRIAIAHNFHLKKCIYQLFLEFADRNLTGVLFQNLSQSSKVVGMYSLTFRRFQKNSEAVESSSESSEERFQK